MPSNKCQIYLIQVIHQFGRLTLYTPILMSMSRGQAWETSSEECSGTVCMYTDTTHPTRDLKIQWNRIQEGMVDQKWYENWIPNP